MVNFLILKGRLGGGEGSGFAERTHPARISKISTVDFLLYGALNNAAGFLTQGVHPSPALFEDKETRQERR